MLDPHTVDVEVDISDGLHSFSIVGLPDKAVEESRDRFAAALKNSGFTSPKSINKKIVVSLAPAEIKKEGPSFDLAIALTYLLGSGDISFRTENKLFLGELSLDGSIRPIRGVLPLVLHAKEAGFSQVFVPAHNAREAALVKGIAIYAVETLRDVIEHLSQEIHTSLEPHPHTVIEHSNPTHYIDFKDVRGQETAKRGLEIAAAGGHNASMYGAPGSGKTMLARGFAGLLPQLTFDEMLEVTGIHSVAGALKDDLVTHPPFRAPHHTASHVSLVGGGTVPRPGEITLAHRGVLFLDEFPEFDRRVIEALRQPLEDRIVSVSRAKGSTTFPANVMLLAAMNPCPCGNFGTENTRTNTPCSCSPQKLERYRQKLSGPIIDRIDIWLDVQPVEHEKLKGEGTGETSAAIRDRVLTARGLQHERFKDHDYLHTNSDMSAKDLRTLAPLEDAVEQTLQDAAKKLNLSARSYHKVHKLARTIADLEENEAISETHVLEALQYRPRQTLT